MNKPFDAIIVITPADYLRVRSNLPRMISNLPSNKIIFIGSHEVGELVAEENLPSKIGFLDENDIIPFDDVADVMKSILSRDSIPRGVVGWYYQQFLKMAYSFHSQNEYYLSWDGDTVPCKPFSMFDDITEKPYFDMKYEYHEEYFNTIATLFPGMNKALKKSFISEHMLFNKNLMKEMIGAILCNESIPGESFYEKILRAIRKDRLISNSFSEFETYGTYVAYKHTTDYRLKNWHSIRYGSIYFIPEELNDDDYQWLAKDFDAVSFEKNQDYNPAMNEFFTNPQYRSKLTARQIIEAIQDSSEGLREEWDD